MPGKVTVDMRIPTLEDMKELGAVSGPCISIFLGGHQGGAGTRPSWVRLRAALADVEQTLQDRDVASTDLEALMAPLYATLEEPELAAGHGDGFALFRSPREFRLFRLPWPVPESVNVESRFVITPILDRLGVPNAFFLLALTLNNVRLLRGDVSRIQEVPLPPDVPRSMDDFEGFDPPDHTLRGASHGLTFTTGTEREKRGKYFHDFSKKIDRGLHAHLLHREAIPLILAGTEVETAIYVANNTYKNLVQPPLFVSPDSGITDLELASQARQALQDWTGEAEKRAVAHYEEVAGTGRASVELQRILCEASAGRVMILLVAEGLRQAGDVAHILGSIRYSGEFLSRSDDLVNAAVIETLRHSGEVLCLPADRMPGKTSIAAVFRY